MLGQCRNEDELGDTLNKDNRSREQQLCACDIQILIDLALVFGIDRQLGERQCFGMGSGVIAIAHRSQRDDVVDTGDAGEIGRVGGCDYLNPASGP